MTKDAYWSGNVIIAIGREGSGAKATFWRLEIDIFVAP